MQGREENKRTEGEVRREAEAGGEEMSANEAQMRRRLNSPTGGVDAAAPASCTGAF